MAHIRQSGEKDTLYYALYKQGVTCHSQRMPTPGPVQFCWSISYVDTAVIPVIIRIVINRFNMNNQLIYLNYFLNNVNNIVQGMGSA